MDRLESYFRGEQDEGKRYDWDGNIRSIAGVRLYNPISPDYAVAHGERKPMTRYNLPRVITSNLTQMSLGGTSFPEINVEEDDAAEEALRKWCRIMKMPARLAEARNFGGSEGTACMSLCTVNGRFRLDVHNPKHVRVLEWADREEFIPARVVKAYSFRREVFDGEAGRIVAKTFWYVRAWDAEYDRTWSEVPEETAALQDWQDKLRPTFEARHSFGFCPFYWCQNLPDSQEEDGQGDYEGTEDKVDELNQLLSSTTRGTKKNVDPTLVIKGEDDDEKIEKGTGAVIFAPNGAEYLELSGTAVTASLQLADNLRQQVLEEVQVVIPREDKITGAAQSAAAMRILYRPMIARCDSLRDQYGELIVRILEDVRRVAKSVRARPAYPVLDEKGTRLLGADGMPKMQKDVLRPDLDPGESDNQVTLRWPEYFAPTSQDIKDSVTTAQAASGGKSVIAHKTAVEYTGRLFGVVDIDEELKAIDADADADADRAAEAFATEAQALGKGPGFDDKPADADE